MSLHLYELPPEHVRRVKRATKDARQSLVRRIVIHTDTITLSAFLKWAGIVETGGRAKELIVNRRIRVNGQIEQRKGRQLRNGDLVKGPAETQLLVVQASDATSAADNASRIS